MSGYNTPIALTDITVLADPTTGLPYSASGSALPVSPQQSVADSVISYTHAAILAVDTPSATLITTAATGASHMQVLNNTGAIIEVDIGLTNPIIVGMGGQVTIDADIPASQAITITPRIIGLTATDYVTINVY